MAFLAMLATPSMVSGQNQQGADGGATREALTASLERMDRSAESPAYSAELRAEARENAARIRSRLERGDFRPGDRIFVRVEQHPELTDTFTVAADGAITLEGVGSVPLTGALRSELDTRIFERVASIIRTPRVQTRSLVRLSLEGAVGRPGFHVVDAHALLSDVLMTAGGPAGGARLDDIRIEREGRRLYSSDVVSEALAGGSTIDQLGLRDGDRVVVPSDREDLLRNVRDYLYIIPTALGLLGLVF